MNIKICADSTCDLSPEMLARLDVTLSPLSVLVDDEVFHDGLDITPASIFEASESGKTVRTTAVNTYEYEELFRACLKKYDAVIHISLSKAFSASYGNACQAAKNFTNVYVVNSRNLSTGSGLMVMDAVRMARDGMAPEDIVRALEAETSLVDASFVIEQVDYLHRGGRCSGVEAVGAKLLHIKPSIEVIDGKMAVGKKYRGSFERCLEHYVADKLADTETIDLSRVFITHSACSDEIVALVRRLVADKAPFKEIEVTTAGCTISTHCGPGTLGILFKRTQPKT